MRKSLVLIPAFLALAACQTPREACISNVSGNLRTINQLITQTEGNVNRGYAIGTRQELRTVRDWCTRTLPDGKKVEVRCDRQEVVDLDVPVAINLNAEEEKLASLRQRQAALQKAVAPAIEQCRLAHPE